MKESQGQLDPQKFYQYYKKLSAHQQAGFLLWPSLSDIVITPEEELLLSKIKPSGIVLFKRNFQNLDQAQNLVSTLNCICSTDDELYHPPFVISVDEEGGRVSRLPLSQKTHPVFEFVKNKDKNGLKQQVLQQIQLAKKIGINCFLAPVLDIFTESDNTVIGDRSFGTTADEVCEYARIVFDVLIQENILPCGKHFPGHGNTKEDSHKSAAISLADFDTLQQREWRPFKYFINLDIPMLMAAHVILPNLSNDKDICETPATLNHFLLTNILKQKLNFNGLVLSDDLRMGAIQHYYETKGIYENYLSHAALDALNAGCDILLSCHSIQEEEIIIDAIMHQLKNNLDFFEQCCAKSYKITQKLSSYLKG